MTPNGRSRLETESFEKVHVKQKYHSGLDLVLEIGSRLRRNFSDSFSDMVGPA